MTPPPLQGIKVVELARILAGPWVGQTLADLGAEVLKIESPEGDDTRGWLPPVMNVDGEEIAAYYLSCNRGKKSLRANFKDKSDVEKVKKLIFEADIVIENFKVGGLKKYGLDYESLRKDHPRLIYCSITGFGQTGPYANRAGYDYLIQGMSGMMDITGQVDGPPQKIGMAFSDIVTGLYGVIGIQAALIEREQSGLGQHIDMALFDSMVSILANQSQNYFASGVSPKRMGNDHPNIVPYSVFPTSDGHIIIAAGNDRQYSSLCEVLDCHELIDDIRFSTNAKRVENRAEIMRLISEKTVMFTRDDLLDQLEQAIVPAAPINSVENAIKDPQIQFRGMHIKPDGVDGLRTPITFSRSELSTNLRPPKLGEHQFLFDIRKRPDNS